MWPQIILTVWGVVFRKYNFLQVNGIPELNTKVPPPPPHTHIKHYHTDPKVRLSTHYTIITFRDKNKFLILPFATVLKFSVLKNTF